MSSGGNRSRLECISGAASEDNWEEDNGATVAFSTADVPVIVGTVATGSLERGGIPLPCIRRFFIGPSLWVTKVLSGGTTGMMVLLSFS